MAGVLDSVNQRTQLVGQNRLELLLFRLAGGQVYGINVFKVKEVLPCPRLTLVPRRHPVVRGLAHIRGGTLAIMDLSMAIGQRSLDDVDRCFVIITEYNRATQGFLVKSVERIVNMNWGAIHPPPRGSGRESYLTAVTEVDGRLVEIIDVEKILAEVSPVTEEISAGVIDAAVTQAAQSRRVLIVYDSVIACKQIRRCIEKDGVETTVLYDGRQAL
ncbi:MAG: chemotaxis protein, partial [Spongiibacteraceae bacterium]|nr:chemotaxis protein [Spongiibacteraceae bacterium]